jgi:cytochrome b561
VFPKIRLRNSLTEYGLVAQLFHWLIVALILVQFVLGYVAADLPLGLRKVALLAQHKSVGITILALAALRILWRSVSHHPQTRNGMRWQRWLAAAMHGSLYVLLFMIPISGWLMSSARNFSVSWFGLVTLPDFVEADPRLYQFFRSAHELLVYALAVLAALHATAAIKHHFIDRDDVLVRMLPIILRRSRQPAVSRSEVND